MGLTWAKKVEGVIEASHQQEIGKLRDQFISKHVWNREQVLTGVHIFSFTPEQMLTRRPDGCKS